MSGNTTSLYSTTSSNGTTGSNNFTTLYPNAQGAIIPTTPYGNANVVALLNAGSDGGNTVGNITATGNISANYFIGNGSQLTGLPEGYSNANVTTLLANFGSNVISTTGNVTGGNLQTTGVVSATGNITTAGYFLGTFAGNISGNLTVPGSNTQVLYNNSGNAGASSNFTYNSATNLLTVNGGQIQAGNFNAGSGQMSALTGNFIDINSTTISATGNVTGAYFIGNGSQLTGIVSSTYGNAQVAAYLSSGTVTSNIITTGNVSGGYILGNGSQLTGLSGTYSNANVATFLANFGSNTISTTGNITAGNISAAGNILSPNVAIIDGNIQVQVLVSNVAAGNLGLNVVSGNAYIGGRIRTGLEISAAGDVIGANLTTSGQVSATGNVTGNYILGNGSQLTGLPATYSNADVATFLANFGSNSISTTGNITASYFLGNGSQLTGIASSYSNANATSLLASFGSNTISTTGNITGGYILGNGSQLTGIAATNVNANALVGNTLSANVLNSSLVSVGNLNGLSVIGNVNTANVLATGIVSATGNVTGNYFIGNGSQLTGVTATGVGTLTSLSVTGNTQTGNLLTGGIVSATGNITGNYFIGNGSQLTGIAASSVDAGNLIGNTLSANVLNSSLVSVGNLNGLSVIGTVNTANVLATGIVSAAGNITGNYILGNGSQLTGIVPTTVGTLASLSVTGNTQTGNLLTGGIVSATGNVTGNYFIGNGSQLTGVSATNVNANALIGTTLSSNVIYSSLQVLANLLYLNVDGNITSSNNISATGFVSATGNVRGNVILGDTILTGGIVSATGNITSAGFFIGNGSQLTGVTAAIGGNASANINMNGFNIFDSTRANVQINDGLSVTGQILGSGLISATGSIVGNELQAGSAGTGNILAGNLSLSGRANVDTLVSNGNVEIGLNLSVTGGISAPGSAINSASLSVTGNIRGGGAGSVLNMNGGNIVSVGSGVGTALEMNGGLNIISGNLTMGGLISATGNVTGNYFIGNGSQLTGITAGSATTAVTVTGNAQPNITSVGTLSSVSSTGTVTGGNILTGGVVSATGNITGGNLITTGLANIAGNITAANVFSYYTSNGTIITSTVASNANATVNPYRIVYGNGYRGDYGANADPVTFNRGSQLAVIGTQVLANADTNNAARLLTSSFYIDLSQGANVTNANKRWSAFGAFTQIGNGNITITGATGTNPGAVLAGGTQTIIVGNQANVQMGNASVSHAVAINSTLLAAGGGTVGNAAGSLVTVQTANSTATITTSQIGYVAQFLGSTGTVAGNVIGYYMPSNVATTFGWNSQNINRAATNYYFLRNDDAVAQNQLGSLRAYHTYQYPSGTSGTVDVDKNNGQIQFIAPTGNITIGNYTNFVTTANDGTNNDTQSDTVTLIIQQGATPYTITMPTGNSSIRYAGGTSTVANTANAVTTITVQAFRSSANASMYLTTISPEFS